MRIANPYTLDLEQVHELNRLFLSFLQRQARNAQFCFGLPTPAIELLAGATNEVLERAAELPRALFRLNLAEPAARDRLVAGDSTEARALLSLQLTILLTVSGISRQSPYRARAFFGVTSRDLQRLRALQLSEIPALAVTSELVACSFDDVEWLWRELLAPDDSPSHRQHLELVALQPVVHRASA